MAKQTVSSQIGTPSAHNSTKVLLLGAGELGKEVALEFQRYGVEVIAVDRYDNAPAMQVAHRRHVISMLDDQALRQIVEIENPDFIVPEIEAIATSTLVALESEGYTIVPSARATQLTMNREGIRCLAAETLHLPTSTYAFADNLTEFKQAINTIGLPAVVKPIMSSSGKGQSLVREIHEIEQAWDHAQSGGRAGNGRVIVEGFVDFDYEITLLTVQTDAGCQFCAPIGHTQIDGDYRTSWQPHDMSSEALAAAQHVAQTITQALGGRGVFGVELFVKGDKVIFSEVSPRPHDTGMVTMISQNLSEFALHVRAILGLPIPVIHQLGPAASAVILAKGYSQTIAYHGLARALELPDTEIRLFGKPEVAGQRRLGVALARDTSLDLALEKAIAASGKINVILELEKE